MRRHYKEVHDSKYMSRSAHCRICDKRFKTERHVLSHVRTVHMGIKPKKAYTCDICGRDYSNKICLEDHMNRHNGEKCYLCDVCNEQFFSLNTLKRHLVLHQRERRRVNVNTEEFVETGKISREDWDILVESRSRICPLCSKSYNTAKDMRRHIREVHVLQKSYQCDECHKKFRSARHVSQHKRRIHLGLKQKTHFNFECHDCGAKFKCKTNLADHMTVHTGIKPHVCEICGNGFTSARGLQRHHKIHLRNSGSLPEEDMFKCDLCDRLFLEQGLLVSHKKWKHGDAYNLCKVCGKRIKGCLKKHMMIHTGERPYCCHICGKKLRGKLKDHMLTHTGDRPFACDICGSSFKQRSYLKVHMRKHSGERPYVCDYCGHTFAARPAYNQHLKRHTEHVVPSSKIFECQICTGCFPSEESLNGHMTEHF